jgi:single-stranded-DNA-specific exonuclease
VSELRQTSSLWNILPTDDLLAGALSEALQIPLLAGQLLVQRNIRSEAEAMQFFRPDWRDLHNPFLMRDMETAVARMEQAIENNERILLYGDYDVDGTTSVAMMYAFLSGFHKNLDIYLPDRDKEGYGVSLEGVEYARQTACTLVVAMDCGIKANEAVAKARSYGIDFIICDHHLPEGQLPDAVANLDPKRPDCDYPFKELSGCGIAFKLIQALAMHYNMPCEELEPFSDLLVVSIACDIVEMQGENRILASYGLKRLTAEPRTGLKALLSYTNHKVNLDINDLVFGLGPIINAAGRLGDARDAVYTMLANERDIARRAAGELAHRNEKRRAVDQDITEEALKMVRTLPQWETRKTIVLFNPDWHKGIIGITASRLSEYFYRPTIVFMESGGVAIGSARSIPGFNLYDALSQCEDLFHRFGGHAHAAGIQMPVEHVPILAQRLEDLAAAQSERISNVAQYDISASIQLEALTPALLQVLERFEPYGPGNRHPVFLARDVVDAGGSRRLNNNHIRLTLRHSDSRQIFKGVGFGLADLFEHIQWKEPFDVIFTVKEEDWRGVRSIVLYVKDAKQKSL